jgi:MFS family permease
MAPLAFQVSNARRWSIVSLLGVAALINYLDRATLSVALPRLSAELALGPVEKGLLLSAFFWSYTAMQLPMGWLADRVHIGWLYAGCFTVWSIACGLTGLAGSLVSLLALRIVLGVGESVYLPGSSKLVSKIFAAGERALPTAIFDCGTRVGLAVGAPLIAWLTVRYGWRRMFLLVGFLALVWLVPWALAFPWKSWRSKLPSLNQRGNTKDPGTKFITINRNLVGSCLGFFCLGYYGYLLVTWLPDYLVQVRGLSILKAGVYASLPFLVWALAEPAGGWLSDRLIRRGRNETRVRKGMIGIGFATGLLLIPAALVETAGSAIWLVAGASLVGFATSNVLVIFQTCAPPEEVGAWTGTGNFIGNFGGIFSPLVTGFLIRWTGSYVPGFVLAALVLLVGLLMYWLVVGELKPPAPEPATGEQP